MVEGVEGRREGRGNRGRQLKRKREEWRKEEI